MHPIQPQTLPAPLLLYDGDCGFCSRAVELILRYEARPALHFAPLSGTTAELVLARCNMTPATRPQSIILFDGNQCLVRSRAVLAAMQHMGGKAARVASVARLLPRPLADAGYGVIARMRRLLPGATTCGVLSPAQKTRFHP